MKYCTNCTGWILYSLHAETLQCIYCKAETHFSNYSKIRHNKVECKKHVFYFPICYCNFIHKLHPKITIEEANIETKHQIVVDFFKIN